MPATVLDPSLISMLRKADTIVFHQEPGELDADVVLHFNHDDAPSVNLTADNSGRSAHGPREIEDLRCAVKLYRFDGGVRETFLSLLRQGDTLRVWTRLGNQVHQVNEHEALVLVEHFVIIKRRPRTTGGRTVQGKELRLLVAAGWVSTVSAKAMGVISL